MRNLPSRIARLEKIVAARPPAPCGLCGTPRGFVAGFIVRDPDGNPLHDERCPSCGIETCGGRVVSPIDPNTAAFRDVLILPAGSAPLPV